jgi:HSP20 family molecular chaperone IbpA
VRQDELAIEFERLYAEIARRARPIRFEPNADVWLEERGTTIVVTVEIAGADPAEMRVGLADGCLYVVGKRIDRLRPRSGSVLMKEIDYGEFAKKIHLPYTVERERATAAYHDGILTISLPVAQRSLVPPGFTELRMIVRRIPG